jgi:branched-subunit amino acid transport protein
MSGAWPVILGSAAGVYALKAAGPLVIGDRMPPRWLRRLTMLLPAALLSALVVVSTAASGHDLELDARALGVAAAAVALWRRANFVVVVFVAAITTAAARALMGSS